MDSRDESLRESVLDQCQRLRKMMTELRGDVPNRMKFSNWIVEIENEVKTDLEAADRSLKALYRDIKTAPDGTGGVILSGRRFERYLYRPDEL